MNSALFDAGKSNLPGVLRVAACEPRSIVNGPGERFVVWLQGCPFRCPGCFNQEFLTFSGGREIAVGDLREVILEKTGLEGVTFSGGEPMAQIESLLELSRQLVAHGLSIVCYTGFTLVELRQQCDNRINDFLSICDVLIDGRYEERQSGSYPWRGSRNQQVHFLTERYRTYREMLPTQESVRDIELIVSAGSYTATGILDLSILNSMDAALQAGVDQ